MLDIKAKNNKLKRSSTADNVSRLEVSAMNNAFVKKATTKNYMPATDATGQIIELCDMIRQHGQE